MRFILVLILFVIPSSIWLPDVWGQQNISPPKRQTPQPCRDDPAFRAFDFWIGQWDVHTEGQNDKVGQNEIRMDEQGCLLFEHWQSTTGSTGQSINYYNPVTKKWRQIWVASAGYAIDIEGGPDTSGTMILTGTVYYYQQGNSLPFRGTWTPNTDGTVRQVFEQYDPETMVWITWFDGLYTRTSPKKTK